MKNVFFFRHYATPPDLPGGRRHFNTALLMTRSGFQTYMFTSNFRHVPKKYAKTFKGMHLIEDYEGVKYVWINNRPPYLKNDWRRLLGMLDYSFKSVVTAWRLKRQGIKPDLIIGSVAHLFAVLAAYIAALLLGAEFWMDIGDLWPEAYVRGGTLKPGNPITIVMSVMSNFLYKRAKKIVVLTENTRKYLVGLGISAEKIIVFGNGALLDPEDKNRAGLERPGGTFTLTYAGSFGDLYPLEELVEAVTR